MIFKAISNRKYQQCKRATPFKKIIKPCKPKLAKNQSHISVQLQDYCCSIFDMDSIMVLFYETRFLKGKSRLFKQRILKYSFIIICKYHICYILLLLLYLLSKILYSSVCPYVTMSVCLSDMSQSQGILVYISIDFPILYRSC